MKLLKKKQGMGLPTMLAIVTFVIAVVATLLTYAVFQANLVDISFESSEAYYNALERVEATASIIVRDQDLDSTYLLDLANYMGVSIDSYNATVWTISSSYSDTQSVTSYLSGSASTVSTFDNLFDYQGNEPGFILDPLITPTSLLAAYLPEFIEATFPSITPQTEFASFQSVVSYINSLTSIPGTYISVSPTILSNQSDPTVSGHWYVDGDLTLGNNRSLTIPEGYLLVINGNLTMNRNGIISGNVVVNGNFTNSAGSNRTCGISGTMYVKGNVSTVASLNLGSSSRPAFVFAEQDITFNTNVNGFGYFLSDNFTVGTSKTNIDIYGGVYASVSSNLSSQDLNANPSLDNNLFYDYGVPTAIDVSASSFWTYDNLFMYKGNEPGFIIDPLLTTTSLLGAYLPEFIETTFPSIIPQTEFADFQSIVSYISSLTGVPGSYISVSPTVLSNQSNPTVSGHWYVNGNLTLASNKNLTIPSGYLLVINGNLTMSTNGTIYGNVVVNGDFTNSTSSSNSCGISGTMYVKGDVSTVGRLTLGNSSRPAFVFSEQDIDFNTNVNGYGYFLSDNFTVGTRRTNIEIYGGVYTTGSSNLSSNDLLANQSLEINLFYGYGVPSQIIISSGGSLFKYSAPE